MLISDREEKSLKYYALKILASIAQRLNLYLEMDTKQNKIEERKEVADDESQMDRSSLDNSTLSTAVQNVMESKLDKYGANHMVKTELAKAAVKFNLKPKNGIAYLQKVGLVASEP